MKKKATVKPESDLIVPHQSVEEMLEVLQKMEALGERKYVITSYTAANTSVNSEPLRKS